ncbi:MAG TPA: hypothetical protein VFV98_06385 [Vicinamibacterales bacterium]|nr:hypothetical protein [Vicinamibacterales bacterium]
MLFCLTPVSALAQARDPHAVQPERPSVATHAGTVAPGWIELEMGATFASDSDPEHGAGVPIAAKIGLTPRFQVTLGGAFVAPTDGEAGMGDLNLALKWRFVESAALGRLAIMPNIKLPTGSQENGTGVDTTDGGLLLILSRSIGPVSMDLNAGYTRRSGDGTVAARDATLWAISFGGPVTARIGWGAELSGTLRTSGPSGEPAGYTLLVGPTFSAASWLSFDTGFSVQLNEDHPYRIYFGGVWNMGRIWP